MVDGRRLDGYTISSPCEPNGSGELKTWVSNEDLNLCGDLSLDYNFQGSSLIFVLLVLK